MLIFCQLECQKAQKIHLSEPLRFRVCFLLVGMSPQTYHLWGIDLFRSCWQKVTNFLHINVSLQAVFFKSNTLTNGLVFNQQKITCCSDCIHGHPCDISVWVHEKRQLLKASKWNSFLWKHFCFPLELQFKKNN